MDVLSKIDGSSILQKKIFEMASLLNHHDEVIHIYISWCLKALPAHFYLNSSIAMLGLELLKRKFNVYFSEYVTSGT
jgi:hypothetical protein